MSVELWKIIFDWGAVILLGLTFAFGAGALITGNILAERQDKELGQLKLQSATAQKDAGDANKKAGEANERAGKFEKEAADLKADNLRLEAIIAPRRLSDGQQKELEALTPFANRVVQIKSYSLDVEGFVLATQIGNALGKSKIGILDNRLTMVPGDAIMTGISVSGSDKALVDVLKKALPSEEGKLTKDLPTAINRGVSSNMSFSTVTLTTPPAATITVGVKPIK